MVERILIQTSAPFRFRVSKPGKSCSSTDMSDYILHESMEVCAPYTSGSVNFAGAGNILVNFGKVFSAPPMIILKRGDNRPVLATGPLVARLQSNMSSMRIYNQVYWGGEVLLVGTCYYYVYDTTMS
jgi:hypothetical protein